jgi:hypothetical protein
MTTALRQTTALRRRMLQHLQLAGLSPRTQEAYLRAVRKLADHFRIPPDRLGEHQSATTSSTSRTTASSPPDC